MNTLETIASLPKKIDDVTTNVSESLRTLDQMVGKLDHVVKGVQTHNPVSGMVFGALSKATEALKKGTETLNKAGETISQSIQPLSTAVQKLEESTQDLQNCQEVMATSALMVSSVVDSCSGHFHPRTVERTLTKFDGQWDSWAKAVNGVYQQLSPTKQSNILENLAKAGFGDNVFYLSSAIKNESAGIFGGIADFEDALHNFRGSYRNPAEAAKKIEEGVKGIVNATERVANSMSNMISIYQRGIGKDTTANSILSKLCNLHDTVPIATINKILTATGGAATLFTDISGLRKMLKSKNPKTIYSVGKKTVGDTRTILRGLKDTKEATKVTSFFSGTATGGAAPVPSPLAPDMLLDETSTANPPLTSDLVNCMVPADDSLKSQEQSLLEDEKRKEGKTDSYVCSGAIMRCTKGTSQARLSVSPSRSVFLTEQPMANISDHLTMINLAPFGRCRSLGFPATAAATAANHGHLTPMPCMHNTPFPWMNGKDDYIIKGNPALLKSSTCSCMWGGTITLVTDGQCNTGMADMSRRLAEQFWKDQPKENRIDVDSVCDGIQMALDIAGLAPGVGAIPDLLNASIYAIRGDWAAAGLSVLAAVPIIGDAATAAKFAQKGMKAAKAAKKAGKQVVKEQLGTSVTKVNNDVVNMNTYKEMQNWKLKEKEKIKVYDNQEKNQKSVGQNDKKAGKQVVKEQLGTSVTKVNNDVVNMNTYKEAKEMQNWKLKEKEKIKVCDNQEKIQKAVGQNDNAVYNSIGKVNGTSNACSYKTVKVEGVKEVNQTQLNNNRPGKNLKTGNKNKYNKNNNDSILAFDNSNNYSGTENNTYNIEEEIAKVKRIRQELEKNGKESSIGLK